MTLGVKKASFTAWAMLFALLFGLSQAVAVVNSVQYLDQLWQIEDGLPGQVVRSVIQTRDGYLWLGTSEMLTRFDGIRFDSSTFKPYNKDRQYVALVETSDGSLWCSSTDGLGRYKDGQTTFYTESNGLPCHYILTVFQDRKGTIWLGATNGLSKYENGKFTRFTSKEGFLETSVRAILEDHTGTLWVGTVEGLIEARDGHTIYHTQPSAAHNAIQCLAETPDGSVWAGTSDGLDRYRDGVCTTYNQKEGELLHPTVRALYVDQTDGLWIGSLGGVQRFHQEKFDRISITGDLAADYNNAVPGFIYSICGDREGDIWVGTSQGLNRLKQQHIHTYRKEDGLPERQINSVLQDRTGDIWIGTHGGGLARIHDQQIQSWKTTNGLSSNRILALCEDHTGALWVGTENDGFNRFVAGKVTQQFKAQQYTNLADNSIKVLLEDRQHTLWIGGINALSCLKDGVFLAPNFNLPMVKTMHEDQEGNIWIGYKRGLARITDGQVKIFEAKDNFPTDMVNTLYEDRAGTLWAGTDTGQLLRLKNGQVLPCLPTHALVNRILSIADDEKDHLWVTTQNGVFRLSKSQLQTLAPSETNVLRNISFGKLDGMKRAQCNGIAQPASWMTTAGDLLIPTIAGLVEVDIKALQVNQIMPKVVIEEIRVGRQLFTGKDKTTEFPPNAEVEFRYTALSLQAPERIAFQCLLEGLDENWQDMGVKRSIRYGNLPPDDYVFRVRARNYEGLWTPVGASFPFTVRPLFYQTGLFWAFCVIVAGGAILGLHRWRVHRLKLREQELTQQVAERTRSLVESQQIILRQERLTAVSQLAAGIAHEFNNILTIIQGHASLLQDDPKLDEEALKSVKYICNGVDRTAELTRQILAFSRKQIMQPQLLDLNATLGHHVHILGRMLEANVRVCCDFATALPAIEADPGVIEQAVMNLAVNARDAMPKGGLITIGTLSVTLTPADALLRPERRAGKFVQLSVTDNGAGMSPAVVNRLFEPFFTTKDVGKGTGLGLATVYGLMQQHNGWIEVDSVVGQGTTFRLYFPASEKSLPVAPKETSPEKVAGGKETILVVEDEPVLRELVQEILQGQGYSILEAPNGVEAIRIWKKENQRIDLLLTDIIMPEGVSGRELAAILRADRPGLPVIFSTGHSREMIERDGRSTQDDSYLSKPYQPSQLSQVVRECLDSAREIRK